MNQGGCDLQIWNMQRGKYGTWAEKKKKDVRLLFHTQVRAARLTTPHTDDGADTSVGLRAP